MLRIVHIYFCKEKKTTEIYMKICVRINLKCSLWKQRCYRPTEIKNDQMKAIIE